MSICLPQALNRLFNLINPPRLPSLIILASLMGCAAPNIDAPLGGEGAQSVKGNLSDPNDDTSEGGDTDAGLGEPVRVELNFDTDVLCQAMDDLSQDAVVEECQFNVLDINGGSLVETSPTAPGIAWVLLSRTGEESTVHGELAVWFTGRPNALVVDLLLGVRVAKKGPFKLIVKPIILRGWPDDHPTPPDHFIRVGVVGDVEAEQALQIRSVGRINRSGADEEDEDEDEDEGSAR